MPVRGARSLERDDLCDAVVVGGGMTGALVAHELVAADVETVLVERGRIAAGSTLANTGILVYEADEPLSELSERIGARAAGRVYRTCANAVKRFIALAGSLPPGADCRPRMSLYLAGSAADVPDLEREARARSAAGLEVGLVHRPELEARFGVDRSAALLTPLAADVNPPAFTALLAQRAIERGLRAYERTPVLSRAPRRGGWELRCQGGRSVRSRWVVLATGCAGPLRFGTRRATMTTTYAVAGPTRAGITPWRQPCVMWEMARPYLYVRAAEPSRVIVGGGDDSAGCGPDADANLRAKAALLSAQFRRLCPGHQIDATHAWGALFVESRDGLAFIGEVPEEPGVYLAAGYGGIGMTYGCLAAEFIRDAVRGRTHPDAALFGPCSLMTRGRRSA